MRVGIITAAIAATLFAPAAFADTLRDGYPVCASENLLDQVYQAMLRRDEAGLGYLFGHGCFITKRGVRVSLLDRSNWGATAHVRIYAAGDAVEAWTSIGAVEGRQD